MYPAQKDKCSNIEDANSTTPTILNSKIYVHSCLVTLQALLGYRVSPIWQYYQLHDRISRLNC